MGTSGADLLEVTISSVGLSGGGGGEEALLMHSTCRAVQVGSKTTIWVVSDWTILKLINKYPDRTLPVLCAIPYRFMGKPYYQARKAEVEKELTPAQRKRVSFISMETGAAPSAHGSRSRAATYSLPSRRLPALVAAPCCARQRPTPDPPTPDPSPTPSPSPPPLSTRSDRRAQLW